LDRAKKIGVKTHLCGAVAIGFMFFAMYLYYAYSFFIGSILITNEKENTNSGEVYKSGDVMSCFLGVVYGMFSIGLATPNIKALIEGQIAGKMAYDIIKRKPQIKLDEDKSAPVKEIKGEIEFKNVHFAYPSRKE
jgi:ATP-binding cassette subfamily B (MDR/TAP) protein 1